MFDDTREKMGKKARKFKDKLIKLTNKKRKTENHDSGFSEQPTNEIIEDSPQTQVEDTSSKSQLNQANDLIEEKKQEIEQKDERINQLVEEHEVVVNTLKERNNEL